MDDELRRARTQGALLGGAVGDALGLPFEGLDERLVSHLPLKRFTLFGRTGFVSDDTEQSALIAQAFAHHPRSDARLLRAVRRSIVAWFLRLPFGIGFGTMRACLRMALGVPRPGVRSAGNGAAMRAGILGVCLAFESERRRSLGRQVAQLTHTDPRAVEGALFVAEVAAGALRGGPSTSPTLVLKEAASVLTEPTLQRAVHKGLDAAKQGLPLPEAATKLGTSGFIVHSLAATTYCFARRPCSPFESIRDAIRMGGDTDSHAAIVGGWVGAMHGSEVFPSELVEALHDGPFGPSHLRRLGDAIARGTPPPAWSWLAALVRNLALFPVILVHGFAHLGRRRR
ncbi:MAG: ADP-ribosylglycohydrolase family protein [Polyangiales bacterium]